MRACLTVRESRGVTVRSVCAGTRIARRTRCGGATGLAAVVNVSGQPGAAGMQRGGPLYAVGVGRTPSARPALQHLPQR